MSRQAYDIQCQVEEALHRVKKSKEFLDMWLNLIPSDEAREGESIRVAIVMDQVIEAISCLKKAEEMGASKTGGTK
ncbi:hypothetical protein [Pectobacterium aroidearum]|uniref:hypothetical protein n=1 Tax=Pectobacterium aroidearum TaxID=1201031 RepID=UPI0021159DDF|nr:hypothetical protein [Pectobacterium aroidearum]UUE44926.1 hypothetical protein L0Y28_20940 [Pectobacterium aroidearum]UUE49145.1 hypothetical protein L0Y23_20820 [Pectobacterium aroidearum]UUE53349.1 hypothetical protein L0Y30_20940 [Pectobacterium aroidearum]UUE61760.1 hypothetical protein L0Y29_20940 [Pectobacterium aroidearum]UUE65984.1 hypothetical protein L0Y22_20935 [Pectobacterium aroidearum]